MLVPGPSSPDLTADDCARGGHGRKPDPARERAIVALLSERSLTAAANRAGVSERTLRRWLADDRAFRAD